MGGKKNATEGTRITQLAEAEPATHVLTRGRQKKFTPERIQQIKNLVERGTSREQIAELIGVTVGSLQVTCSRLGVSLRRRPNVNTGAGLLRRDGPRSSWIAGQNPNGGDIVPLQPAKERLEEKSRPGPVEQAQASTACEEPAKEEPAKRANERPPRTSPSGYSTGAKSEQLNCRSIRIWSDNSRLRQSSGT